MRSLLRCLLILLVAWPTGSGVADAQVMPTEPSRPFSVSVADWNRKLAAVEEYVSGVGRDPARSDEFQKITNDVEATALAERARAQRAVNTLEQLIAALGPPPAEPDAAEDPDVAAQRAQYKADITDYRGRIALAELALARAASLEERISALYFERLTAKLRIRYPSPLLPTTLKAALPEAAQVLTRIAAAPRESQLRLFPRDIGFIAGALIAGWLVRRFLLRRFGRDPAVAEPTFTQRLIGAFAEGLARGLIPAAVVTVVLVRVSIAGPELAGPFPHLVALACQSLILFILATALPRAALAPDMPQWRVAGLSRENAQQLARVISFLAAFYAVDFFFFRVGEAFAGGLIYSEELRATYALLFNVVEGLGLLVLLRRTLWSGEGPRPEPEEATEPSEADEPPSQRGRPVLHFVRRLAIVLTVAAIIGTVVGFTNFGTFVINNLLGTGVVGGLLYLLRGFLRDLISIGLRSQLTIERLQLKHRARRLIRFWLRAALDLLVLIAAVFAIAPVWDIPVLPLAEWLIGVLSSLQIGSVTISMADIATALLVFIVALVVVRWLQRGLAERVLPETQMERGLQHSVAAGFGYLGIFVAAVVAISVGGIDLSNLALIFGALSVGIGFGLQNVVNNFVSGIILLIERPIQVGDWVVVGTNEGTVKRIQVRATEIETFQRASVIIPNSELLSTSVTNWTHKDRLGRVEIPVGVAYGSDPERVRQILLDVAAANSQVTKQPPPYVRFKDFGDSALIFELRAYLYDIGQIIVVSTDLRFAINAAFREHGIEIPFPQRDLHIKDRNAPAGVTADAGRPTGATADAPAESAADAESPPAATGIDPEKPS
ncbi:MAG: mechanosensitive ion channel family protein [Rhodospirillales bacterium]|nr:MAG: mechanosensitive ion channel family protein [Rhodospirillales bacterium]